MIPYSLNPMGFGDPYMSDLDILRQIRDANPTSQLPTLWLDSKDPYTQWEGVDWTASRVTSLNIGFNSIQTLQDINKLTALRVLNCYINQLTAIDLTGLTALLVLNCFNNQITTINVTGTTALQTLRCNSNKLTAIPSLTSKGLITDADFTHNLMLTTETTRLLAMGFTTAQVLPQDI